MVCHRIKRYRERSSRLSTRPGFPVGIPDWYHTRHEFFEGSIGVAACWWGASVGIGRAVLKGIRQRNPDQLALFHLGTLDALLSSARTTLSNAAKVLEQNHLSVEHSKTLALRVRTMIFHVAEQTIQLAHHALGPAPLTTDEHFAQQVADLTLYLRQYHAGRDEAALGKLLTNNTELPW